MSDTSRKLIDEITRAGAGSWTMEYLRQEEERRKLLLGIVDPHSGEFAQIAARAHREYEFAKLQNDIISGAGLSSATMKFLHQDDERRRLLSQLVSHDFVGTDNIVAEAQKQFELMRGPIEEARRIGLLDPDSEVRRSFAAAIEAHQSYSQMFRLPVATEFGHLAREAMASSLVAQKYLTAPDQLRIAMEGIHSAWLSIDHVSQSARAFADIVGIGQGLSTSNPFEAELVGTLRSSLGDWRAEAMPTQDLVVDPFLRRGLYHERGVDPAISDFTDSAFKESINVAGLGDTDAELEHSENAERAGLAFEQLRQFEIAVRDFIDRVMQKAFGSDWMKRRLPNDMLAVWHEKREVAIKAGETERPLIYYADFADYKKIIERRDNWAEVFKPIFGRPEDIRESFQRLFPVRIATMHSRIVTLDDELLLRVETRRILKAIDRSH